MTLKTRNRLMTVFSVLSILSLIGILSLLISNIANGTFKTNFGYDFFSLTELSFFKPSEKAVLFSFIILQFYIPITILFLYFKFEKTQSSLIILFSFFLLGNQLEISRFYIALFNLKQTYSYIYLLLGNSALLGKIISLFSFFLIALESKKSQKLDVEIDLIIILTLSIFVTVCIPLNTSSITKTFGIKYGFSNTVLVLFVTILLLTVITFIFSYRETENKSILKFLVSYLFIIIGVHVLTDSDILFFILLGAALLITGTNLYMKALHKMYLWD